MKNLLFGGAVAARPRRLLSGRGRRKHRGAAVVEFAIIAPLFFLLIFGIVEFGRMVMVQQILTNASREGARRAIIESATRPEVETHVLDYLTNASINGATVSVTPDDSMRRSATW